MNGEAKPDLKVEHLDAAERWLADGLRVAESPGLALISEVDMSQARLAIERLRAQGINATYTHMFVHAAAVALARHPDLHQIVIGRRRYRPQGVDIGLSVSATAVVAPVLVIENADEKSPAEIAVEIINRAPEVRAENARMLAAVKRSGWLVPFGWLRRLIVRILMRDMHFRRRGAGTFQVSCLSEVDVFAPLILSTAAILGTGRVRDRVVAVDGQPCVKPTVFIACSADHKAWDGARAMRFLGEVKKVLETAQSAI